jgi:hypothetical protein
LHPWFCPLRARLGAFRAAAHFAAAAIAGIGARASTLLATTAFRSFLRPLGEARGGSAQHDCCRRRNKDLHVDTPSSPDPGARIDENVICKGSFQTWGSGNPLTRFQAARSLAEPNAD